MAQGTYGVLMSTFNLGRDLWHQAGDRQVLLQVEFEQYSIGCVGCHCS